MKHNAQHYMSPYKIISRIVVSCCPSLYEIKPMGGSKLVKKPFLARLLIKKMWAIAIEVRRRRRWR